MLSKIRTHFLSEENQLIPSNIVKKLVKFILKRIEKSEICKMRML